VVRSAPETGSKGLEVCTARGRPRRRWHERAWWPDREGNRDDVAAPIARARTLFGPTAWSPRFVGVDGDEVHGGRGIRGQLRHDAGPQLRARSEHAMEARERVTGRGTSAHSLAMHSTGIMIRHREVRLADFLMRYEMRNAAPRETAGKPCAGNPHARFASSHRVLRAGSRSTSPTR
jgi:hypothetical protein